MKVLQVIPSAEGRAGGIDAVLGMFGEGGLGFGEVEGGEGVEVGAAEVVHFHGLWNPGHRRLYEECARRKVPWVVSPHGMLEPWAWRHRWWKKWPYFHLVERWHLQGAAALHATSEMERFHLAGRFPGQRMEVIPPCVGEVVAPDYVGGRERLGWGAEDYVILFLSRLHPKKGLHVLIEALGPLAPLVDRPVRLVVVGGGEPGYVGGCRRRAECLGLRVDWVGPVWGAGRWDYFRGADLFCLPTFSENFGVAVLEALQVGTPVLTTRETPWGEFQVPAGLILVEPEVEEVRAQLSATVEGAPWTEGARAELSRWVHATFEREGMRERWTRFYQSVRR